MAAGAHDGTNTAILIVGPSWVGDLVMAQSLFKLLAARQPAPALDVLAPAGCLDLLRRMPEVRRALEMPIGHGRLALGERYRLGRQLRGEQYAQAIVLPNSFKSALLPWFARIPQRTGWRGEVRHGLLNDLRRLDRERLPLMVQRYAALALPRGQHPLAIPHPELQPDRQRAARLRASFGLDPVRPVLAICPGAEFGPAKRWPAEYFAVVAGALIDSGWQVWLFGSAADRDTARAVRDGLVDPARGYCFDLAGRTTLADAIDLLACAQRVLSNDSGLMHVAAALGKPLVVVYGGSSPRFTPPLSDDARLLSPAIECAPCMRRDCRFGHYRCLGEQRPQRVLELLGELPAARER